MAKSATGLNARQTLFVSEYLVDLNASEAAIRAGYSRRTAGQHGRRLLQNATVLAAIQRAQAARVARVQVRADDVLRELARLAFGDLRNVFDESGNLKRMNELDDTTAAVLSSVEVVTRSAGDGEVEYVHKVRCWDKPRALEMLAKHLGLLSDGPKVAVIIGEQITSEQSAALESYTEQWKQRTLRA